MSLARILLTGTHGGNGDDVIQSHFIIVVSQIMQENRDEGRDMVRGVVTMLFIYSTKHFM